MLIAGLSLIVTAMGQSAAGDAARADEQRRLEACIARIEEEPEEAYEDGLAWVGEGGRALARQCTALALVGLGYAAEGAGRLEQLANAKNGGSIGQRVVFLTQAGNAWILAGDPGAALMTLGNALRLSPTDPNLNADRAAAYMELERWEEAMPDLDVAAARLPRDLSVLQMRAEALLNLERPGEAWKDVERALELDGENIPTLLLRGRVRDAMRRETEDEPDPRSVEIIGTE